MLVRLSMTAVLALCVSMDNEPRTDFIQQKKIAERFAPYLHFDTEMDQYLMSADLYYQKVMKHQNKTKMLNPVLDKNAESNPTYFRIVKCTETHWIIFYQFFYGYQSECNAITPAFIREHFPSLRGYHHGDWEGMMVEISKNNYDDIWYLDKIKFISHGDYWTKTPNDLDVEINDDTHPSGFVGRINHGTYHYPHKTVLHPCLFWSDDRRRNPLKILKTELNLINLNDCNEEWCKVWEYNVMNDTKNLHWGPPLENVEKISTDPYRKWAGAEVCDLGDCSGEGCNSGHTNDLWLFLNERFAGTCSAK